MRHIFRLYCSSSNLTTVKRAVSCFGALVHHRFRTVIDWLGMDMHQDGRTAIPESRESNRGRATFSLVRFCARSWYTHTHRGRNATHWSSNQDGRQQPGGTSKGECRRHHSWWNETHNEPFPKSHDAWQSEGRDTTRTGKEKEKVKTERVGSGRRPVFVHLYAALFFPCYCLR